MLGKAGGDSHEEKRLFKEYRYNINFFPMLVCFINAAVGRGIISLGSAFKCGVFTSLILCTVIGFFSYYSMFFFVKAGAATHSGTFEDIWAATFGPRTIWICAFLSISRKFVTLKSYFSYIITTTISLINKYQPEGVPWWALTNEFYLLIFIIIFIIPFALTKSLKTVAIISEISCGCIIFLFAVLLYYFIDSVKTNGFDPNNEIVYFSFDSRASSCLSSLMTAYLVYPLAYPGLNHLRHATVKRLNALCIVLIAILWLLYYAFGLICYLTLFNKNKGGSILSYYPDGPLKTVAEVVLMLMIATTIPIVISPMRYIMINIYVKVTTIQYAIWVVIGIIIGLIGIVLIGAQGDFSTYLGLASDLLAPIVLWGLPAILYTKACGKQSIVHFIGAIFTICLCVAAIVFIVYMKFFN